MQDKDKLMLLIEEYEQTYGLKNDTCRSLAAVGEISLGLEILADNWYEAGGTVSESSKAIVRQLWQGRKIDQRCLNWMFDGDSATPTSRPNDNSTVYDNPET